MPIWRAFYGGMKDGVELSFLGLFELFLARYAGDPVGIFSGRIRIRRVVIT